MVTWTADGRLAGYNPSTLKLDSSLFHFNFAGSGTTPVDLVAGGGGHTRLQYAMPAGAPAGTYPNKLGGSLQFSFTAADFTTNNATTSSRGLTGAFLLVRADKFPAGYQPTANEILTLGPSVYGVAQASHYYWSTSAVPATTFIIAGWPAAQLSPGTKYWVLAAPFVRNSSGAIEKMKNVDYNVHARILSIITNQRPAKPVITLPDSSPDTGQVLNLTFTLGDPDQETPTALHYNRDAAGVEFAFSPLPTTENPNPTKTALVYKMASGTLVNASVTADQPGVFSADERWKWLDGAVPQIKIFAGGYLDNPYDNDIPPGHAGLPSGDWLVYVRVADYGHPYPQMPDNPLYKYPGIDSFSKNPAINVSPWSDPVRIKTQPQVPAPIILSPKDSVAIVEGTTIPMSYRFRSAHVPVLNQQRRIIQVKRTRDTEWTTVDSTDTSSTTFDMPPSLVSPPVSSVPAEVLPDPGFESGTGGFTGDPSDARRTVGWVSDATKAYSGSGFLEGRFSGSENYLGPYTIGTYPLTAGWTFINVSGWIHSTDPNATGTIGVIFYDSMGTAIAPTWENVGFGVIYADEGEFGPSGWGYCRVLTSDYFTVDGTAANPNLRIPPGAVSVEITSSVATLGAVNPVPICRWDEFSVVGFQDYPEGSIDLVETTEYEWRVRATDTLYVQSAWSEPERFWIVPAPVSGNTRPVPESTLDGASLGCGTYTAAIYRRGGLERVGVLSGITELDWSRNRDDISTAKVVVADWDIDCGNLLSQLQTWAYELVLFRNNGYSVDRVWEGPLTLLTYERDQVAIHAKDVMAYAYRRILRQKMDDHKEGRTVVARGTQILQNAFAPDDPNVLANLNPINNSSDAMQYRSTPAYSRTSFEEVDDMAANAGLDYTTVGRSILLWGTRNRIGTLPEFRDKDLGNSPIVSEYGMNMANRYSISDGNGIHGEADRLNNDDQDPTYGLVEVLSSTWASDTEAASENYTSSAESIQKTIDSFEEYAERSISDRYPPPVVVRVPDNTPLNPDTVISIQQLVPGVVIPLRSTGTLRTVVASQKLDAVTVRATEGTETISVTMSPFSREDSAVDGDGE